MLCLQHACIRCVRPGRVESVCSGFAKSDVALCCRIARHASTCQADRSPGHSAELSVHTTGRIHVATLMRTYACDLQIVWKDSEEPLAGLQEVVAQLTQVPLFCPVQYLLLLARANSPACVDTA